MKRLVIDPLSSELVEWIKSTVKTTDVSQSQIGRAALELAMNDKDFRANLAQYKLKAELEAVEEKIRTFQAKASSVKQRLKESVSV